MSSTVSPRPVGPRPRRSRRGDFVVVLFAVILWGIATGSPLMRPKQSEATTARPAGPVLNEPAPLTPAIADDELR